MSKAFTRKPTQDEQKEVSELANKILNMVRGSNFKIATSAITGAAVNLAFSSGISYNTFIEFCKIQWDEVEKSKQARESSEL